MKIISIILFSAMACVMIAGCKGEIKETSNPDRNGLVLDLTRLEKQINFGLESDSLYSDFQDVLYPVLERDVGGEKVRVLTTQQMSDGSFVSPADPVIFHAVRAPNFGQTEIGEFNFPVKYTSRFRLTDSIRTTIDGSCNSVNEPQGFIMAIIFLAGDEPYGALMAMAFIDGAFPNGGTINPGLYENVILTMNYDGESSGHVIAVADVNSLNVNDFHTMSLQIHDDASLSDPVTGKRHGPSISVFMDDVEVIRYSNNGNTHSLSKGAWDTESSPLGQGPFSIANDVLGIQSTPKFFNGTTNGMAIWNELWETAIYKPPVNLPDYGVTSLITFGAMYQIGTTDGVTPDPSKFKSAEVSEITVTRE